MTWMLLGLVGLVDAHAQSSPAAATSDARLAAAVGLAEAGQTQAARDALQALARDFPDRPEPLLNLAVLLERDGDLAAARAMAEAAVRTSAPHARAYDQLQRLHAQMASLAYQRALRLNAKSATSAPALSYEKAWIGSAPGAHGAPAASASASADWRASPVVAASAASAHVASAAPAASSAPARTETDDGRSMLISALIALVIIAAGTGVAWAKRHRASAPAAAASTIAASAPADAASAAVPEDRLFDIYRLVARGQLDQALAQAQALVREVPGFGLAQLLYGDLLLAHTGQLASFGQAGSVGSAGSAKELEALKAEAQARLGALAEPPPAQLLPRQFIQLPNSVRQAVAVDVSRSRLYLLDNRDGHLQLRSSHYVAIGSAGAGKRNEGDQRTPLGVYQITNRLDGRQLGDFYGPGALPLDYPNEHDRRLGRTGANVWLHGTPSAQYARAPRSTNGCVVLANDDMKRLLRELVPRRTPVLIAQRIEWVSPRAQSVERQAARQLVDGWRQARAQGDLRRLEALYARHFDNGETGLDGWLQRLREELKHTGPGEREVIDMSILGWQEDGDHLLVDFTEVAPGAGLRPHKRRQYWAREGGQWKIFSEGVFE